MRRLKTREDGVHLPAHLLITSPHTLHFAITQLQHGCCIHQLQSLLGNPSHHLHSLQVTSARRRPLQQDLLGWGPQFKGRFLMSPRGDIIKEFQHGRRGGDLHKPQLPALHLHRPSARKPCAVAASFSAPALRPCRLGTLGTCQHSRLLGSTVRGSSATRSALLMGDLADAAAHRPIEATPASGLRFDRSCALPTRTHCIQWIDGNSVR
jgi:hypothetical protein